MVFADRGSMAFQHADQVRYYAVPRTPASWPHQVGTLPPRVLSFQRRPVADRLRAAVGGGGSGGLC
ncbi:hypothetical protein AB0L59_10935, partial [Streptomyces sp. NPDC052109]|uniref:hypothetical protein n=1 Tax=Streptomyces sp. NPDC052109 TaxID=3155527 RepID=UPI003447F817